MFQRVRIRITLLTVSLLLVLYTVSSFTIFTIVQKAVMRQINGELRTFATAMTVPGVAYAQFQLPPGIYAMIYTGGTVFQSPEMPSGLDNALLSLLQSKTKAQGIVDLKVANSSYRVLFAVLRPSGSDNLSHFFVLAENDTRQAYILARLKDVLWIVGTFGALGSTLAGFYLAERVLRPIRTAWNHQLEFVSNASHELRTPLAVIQTNLGIVMEHTDQSIVDNLEWLNNAHSESRRLAKLVQDLLTLARSDSEKSPIARETVDITALSERIRDIYDPIVQMGHVQLRIDAPPGLHIIGDKDRLHQLLVILLDNARKFTPPGGTITIKAEKSRGNMTIEVIDTGEGIAPADLQRVFERFYTSDESRTRSDKSGVGLGLPIAKWIVDAHGGKIAIHSKGVGQGTTVRVDLPLVN